jgi:hypothetical protein
MTIQNACICFSIMKQQFSIALNEWLEVYGAQNIVDIDM